MLSKRVWSFLGIIDGLSIGWSGFSGAKWRRSWVGCGEGRRLTGWSKWCVDWYVDVRLIGMLMVVVYTRSWSSYYIIYEMVGESLHLHCVVKPTVKGTYLVECRHVASEISDGLLICILYYHLCAYSSLCLSLWPCTYVVSDYWGACITWPKKVWHT